MGVEGFFIPAKMDIAMTLGPELGPGGGHLLPPLLPFLVTPLPRVYNYCTLCFGQESRQHRVPGACGMLHHRKLCLPMVHCCSLDCRSLPLCSIRRLVRRMSSKYFVFFTCPLAPRHTTL